MNFIFKLFGIERKQEEPIEVGFQVVEEPEKELLLFPDRKIAQKVNAGDIILFPKRDIEGNVVINKYPGVNLKILLQQILNALIHISEERLHGVTVLIKILRGSKENEMEKYKFQNIPEYGVCATISSDDLKVLIQWLLDNQFITQSQGMYPKLHITFEGKHFEHIITAAQLKNCVEYFNANQER